MRWWSSWVGACQTTSWRRSPLDPLTLHDCVVAGVHRRLVEIGRLLGRGRVPWPDGHQLPLFVGVVRVGFDVSLRYRRAGQDGRGNGIVGGVVGVV